MRYIPFEANPFVPPGHDTSPGAGVLKKVLFARDDLQPGRVQMVNWATLAPGKHFSAHYHEDMQEIFLILEGEARMRVGAESVTLGRGDAVLVEPREVHQMENLGAVQVDYLAIGITDGAGGRTVVVEES